MQRYGILVSVAGVVAAAGLEGVFGQWPVAGQNLRNTRSAAHEKQISPANLASLAVKWTFTTVGDVSATPTVAHYAVYVPELGG